MWGKFGNSVPKMLGVCIDICIFWGPKLFGRNVYIALKSPSYVLVLIFARFLALGIEQSSRKRKQTKKIPTHLEVLCHQLCHSVPVQSCLVQSSRVNSSPAHSSPVYPSAFFPKTNKKDVPNCLGSFAWVLAPQQTIDRAYYPIYYHILSYMFRLPSYILSRMNLHALHMSDFYPWRSRWPLRPVSRAPPLRA